MQFQSNLAILQWNTLGEWMKFKYLPHYGSVSVQPVSGCSSRWLKGRSWSEWSISPTWCTWKYTKQSCIPSKVQGIICNIPAHLCTYLQRIAYTTASVIKARQDRPQPTISVTDGTPEYSIACEWHTRASVSDFQALEPLIKAHFSAW